MWPIQVGQQRIERERKWIVAARLDLAENQSPLTVDLGGGQGRRERDLGHQPQQGLPVPCERPGADLGEVDITRCVDVTAQALGRVGETGSREVRGAPDRRALEEVRDPGRLRCLEARSCTGLERHGHDARRRIFAHEEPQPVGQRVAADVARLRGRRLGEHENEQANHEQRKSHRVRLGTSVTLTYRSGSK